eukprot:929248_1
MNKCPDTADHDDYSITLDRDEPLLNGCFARDSCHNTEPMNTQQEYDALEESMSTGNAKLQTQKEERERTAKDYEMRFSDIEKNYKFNHEYGNWYDNKRNDSKRRFY